MGYYTNYLLEIKHHSGPETRPSCLHNVPGDGKFCSACGKKIEQLPILDDIMAEHLSYFGNDYDLSELVDGNLDQCKWYEHREDMQAISEKYPGFLFILSGEGEENHDIWKEYYLGGKVQIAPAKITIAEFDESLLE